VLAAHDDRPGPGVGRVVDEHEGKSVLARAVAVVLVLGLRDEGAVEVDRGDGVKAEGNEVVALGAVDGPLGLALVLPDGAADPLVRGLVVCVEGRDDDASGEQVGVGASRHGCGEWTTQEV